MLMLLRVGDRSWATLGHRHQREVVVAGGFHDGSQVAHTGGQRVIVDLASDSPWPRSS
jgi:hypothetical protein